MGFHVCEYCTQTASALRQLSCLATSSGDVTLYLTGIGLGRKWVMPDMIVHYVRDHGYKPPEDFIHDVMHGQYAGGERGLSEGISTSLTPTKSVGYLSGDFSQGEVPAGFVEKLESLMQRASSDGNRRQTRGIHL